MSRVVRLPCYGIKLKTVPPPPGVELFCHPTTTIESSLEKRPPFDKNIDAHDGAMHALESMILAHFLAGVDVEDPAYIQGIETAVDACANCLT